MNKIKKIQVAMAAVAMGAALSGAVQAEEQQLILGQVPDRPGFWEQRKDKRFDKVGFELDLIKEAPPSRTSW